jgi:hypothetical protein
MNIIVPWIMFGAAVLGIAVYANWGRSKRVRANYGADDKQNPRKAA